MTVRDFLFDPYTAMRGGLAFFLIHGACYFTILYRLKRSGVRVRLVQDIGDSVRYYREFFMRAPARGWSRFWIYCSVLSLCIAIIWPVACIVHLPRAHKTHSSISGEALKPHLEIDRNHIVYAKTQSRSIQPAWLTAVPHC